MALTWVGVLLQLSENCLLRNFGVCVVPPWSLESTTLTSWCYEPCIYNLLPQPMEKKKFSLSLCMLWTMLCQLRQFLLTPIWLPELLNPLHPPLCYLLWPDFKTLSSPISLPLQQQNDEFHNPFFSSSW